jgi:Holliday junction resolvase
MAGAKHRAKGNRIEREIVELHRELGVHAERYPLSGASHFRGEGHDIDVYALGSKCTPLKSEVKARGNGAGFTMLEKWMGRYDVLFLRRDHAAPLVVLPWEIYARLREWSKKASEQ